MQTTDRRHGDESPPVGIQHVGEGGAGVVVLEDVGQGGEDEDTHRQKQHLQKTGIVLKLLNQIDKTITQNIVKNNIYKIVETF